MGVLQFLTIKCKRLQVYLPKKTFKKIILALKILTTSGISNTIMGNRFTIHNNVYDAYMQALPCTSPNTRSDMHVQATLTSHAVPSLTINCITSYLVLNCFGDTCLFCVVFCFQLYVVASLQSLYF